MSTDASDPVRHSVPIAAQLRPERARSATDSNFLDTLESWLRARPEILVMIRYSRAAGSKDVISAIVPDEHGIVRAGSY